MRGWFGVMAACALLWAAGGGVASAQSPIACGVAAQTVCEDGDLAGLESERAALVAQITAADPQNAALAGEQTWADGLGACGEDIACYRTAYLNHNQTLRQAASTLPGGAAVTTEGAVEEPPADAPTVEEETAALDTVQEERFREARGAKEDGQHAYVATGLPGWGFFTMIGVSFLIFWWLMRALGRHREEMREANARLRGRWR